MSGKRKRATRRNRGQGNAYLIEQTRRIEDRANGADLSAERRAQARASALLAGFAAPASVESVEDKAARLLADMARLSRGTVVRGG